MKPYSGKAMLSVLAFALTPFAGAWAEDLPPENARPLSAILAAAQQQGAGEIAEADFDHGRWEITACQSGACQKLYFNPLSGTKEGQRSTDFEPLPSATSEPITHIVQRIETARLGVVTGVDFDHGHWKIELVIPPANTH